MTASCYQELHSYYQITPEAGLPDEEEEKEQYEGEMRFFENVFLFIYLTFWLSYSTYSIITGLRTQQVNCMETFCVNAGIWRASEARESLSGVYKLELVRYIYYKYSTLPRGISINIAPKVGIFPEAKGRGNYSLPRVQYY